MLLLPSVRPLHMDDEVMSLREEDQLTADGTRVVRLQIIRVRRGDKLVEFPRELGLSSTFAAGPFLIPALGAHSVGEVMEMAEQLRPVLARGMDNAMAAHRAEFNVVEAAIQKAEMTRAYMRQNHRTYRRDSGKG